MVSLCLQCDIFWKNNLKGIQQVDIFWGKINWKYQLEKISRETLQRLKFSISIRWILTSGWWKSVIFQK